MPERSGVLNTNVEKNAKVDSTANCCQVLARTLVADDELGSTTPTTMFLTITKYRKILIVLDYATRRAAATIPATAYTKIRR